MKYFVSIENNDYHRWQIELLIESFKLHNKQDDLVIAIAKNDEPAPRRYFKNLLAHENKFVHDNIGRGMGHLPLNKLYAMAHAVHEGYVGEEFMSIHPDMLLYKTLNSWPESTPNVLFCPNNDDDDMKLAGFKKNFLRKNSRWMSMGDSMRFRKTPESFFVAAYNQMIAFLEMDGTDWDIERAAWMASAAVHANNNIKISFGEANMEMSLLHPNDLSFLIHYKHGVPTYFNKRNYKRAVESSFVLSNHPNPMDAMMTDSPTILTDFLHHLIQRYREK